MKARRVRRRPRASSGHSYQVLETRNLLAVFNVSNSNDAGVGSLREAITFANQDGLVDEIRFNIPGAGVRTITLQTELPLLTAAVTIDGWSQPGFSNKPLIKLLDGNGVDYGIQVFTSNCVIRGMIVSGFDNCQLAIWSGLQNKVQGSYFGTNDAGTALDGPRTSFDAIFLGDGAQSNIIGIDGDGVTDTLERNIVGNGQSGIGIWGANTFNNRVAGNYIGTNASQANLGNAFAGIWIDNGASQNIIGANNDGISDTAEGNIIGRNATNGVVVNNASSVNNRLSRNLIRNNGYLEIDLGNNGADVNDSMDSDTGPNGFTNYPTLTGLSVGLTNFQVSGTYSAAPTTAYRIEFFATSTANKLGYGGSQKYLGFTNVTTDAGGLGTFSPTITSTFGQGWFVSATATDPLGNTSEFSAPIWAGVNLSQTFLLQSNPAAAHTIYLDFDGHTTEGTQWNTFKNIPSIVTPAFSMDADPAFSFDELLRIQNIYERVVEDFRPFNVNVTTQQPVLSDLIKENVADTRWGVRVAIGGSFSDWYGASAGGVAYLNSFNWNSDTPAFVFSVNNFNAADLTSLTVSHEVGHALGLSHDGTPTQEYYGGHGSGDTSWNAIMGGGSSANLTQWSKGEYFNANNSQDDLAIITTLNGFGYVVDDVPGTLTGALPLASPNGTILKSGVISTRTDRDYFFFETAGGAIDLQINGAQIGSNMDILARLLDSNGAAVVSSNPADGLTARLVSTLLPGRYYVTIDGIGKGDPLATGYTDYGSLGGYTISGLVAGLNQGPTLGGIGGSTNYSNNSTSSVAFAGGATVVDPDSSNFLGGKLTVSITGGIDASNRIQLAGGTFTRSGSNIFMGTTLIGTVNSGGGVGLKDFVVTLTVDATPAVTQLLIRALRFRTISNTNFATRQIAIDLTDGDGGFSNRATTTVQVI